MCARQVHAKGHAIMQTTSRGAAGELASIPRQRRSIDRDSSKATTLAGQARCDDSGAIARLKEAVRGAVWVCSGGLVVLLSGCARPMAADSAKDETQPTHGPASNEQPSNDQQAGEDARGDRRMAPPTESESGTKVCGGFAGDTCEASEYCAYRAGQHCRAADASATCQPRPEMCTEQYQPVCGCDNRTYGNACSAAAAGQGVLSEGECPPSPDDPPGE